MVNVSVINGPNALSYKKDLLRFCQLKKCGIYSENCNIPAEKAFCKNVCWYFIDCMKPHAICMQKFLN